MHGNPPSNMEIMGTNHLRHSVNYDSISRFSSNSCLHDKFFYKEIPRRISRKSHKQCGHKKIGKRRIERRKEVVSTKGFFLLFHKERLLMVRRISKGEFPEGLMVSSPTSGPHTRHSNGGFHRRHYSERCYIDFHR